MNFTFAGLGIVPQVMSNKVSEIQTETNVLNQADRSASLFQVTNHNVAEYCDKSVFSTTPSLLNNTDLENRPIDWINVSNRNSMESDKKVYNSYSIVPSNTNQTMGVVWQSRTMTQNASTMTDWEMPENLCKMSVSNDNNEIKSLANENGYLSHCNWNSCSRIHLQRQENAMAEYLARLRPLTLPCIQQFLNRHHIKPIKDDGSQKRTKIQCHFKARNSEIKVVTDLDGSTVFCCPECRAAYPERERLEAHMAVHKSERRFECNLCGACLKRKEHLDQHKRRHSEERPFICEICCKGFKRNEHLRRHFIIHSGSKMYTCSECGKAFSRKDHLNKHAQTHVTKRIKSDNVGLGLSMISYTPD